MTGDGKSTTSSSSLLLSAKSDSNIDNCNTSESDDVSFTADVDVVVVVVGSAAALALVCATYALGGQFGDNGVVSLIAAWILAALICSANCAFRQSRPAAVGGTAASRTVFVSNVCRLPSQLKDHVLLSGFTEKQICVIIIVCVYECVSL